MQSDGDNDYDERCTPGITSSYHDNHDYASSAFPAGSTGTLETYMKKKSATVMMMIRMMQIITQHQ